MFQFTLLITLYIHRSALVLIFILYILVLFLCFSVNLTPSIWSPLTLGLILLSLLTLILNWSTSGYPYGGAKPWNNIWQKSQMSSKVTLIRSPTIHELYLSPTVLNHIHVFFTLNAILLSVSSSKGLSTPPLLLCFIITFTIDIPTHSVLYSEYI